MSFKARQHTIKPLLLTLSFFLFTFAESSDDLDLAALLNLTVESASRSEMPIQKSPGVIRVISSDDFEDYSMKSLADVLKFVPGVQIERSYKNTSIAWIRGIQTRYNSKILFLVDGVPIRDGYYGHVDIDNIISLKNVEKIEIINGPGSVLYGPNAFAGVVSVTTKFGKEKNEAGVAYAGGRNGNRDTDWYSQGELYSGFGNDNFRIYGEMSKGTIFEPAFNSSAETYNHDNKTSKMAVFSGFKTKKFKGTFTYEDIHVSDVFQDAYEDELINLKPLYGAIEFESDLPAGFNIKVLPYASLYNVIERGFEFVDEYPDENDEDISVSKEDRVLAEIDTTFIKTLLLGADIEVTKKFGDANELKFGVLAQQDRSYDKIKKSSRKFLDDGLIDVSGVESDSKLEKDAKRETVGFFIQDMWNINDKLTFVGAVRYDYLSDFDNQFNFRTALTGMTEGGLYGKVLAGSAYRVPVYREYLKAGNINTKIQPEQIYTIEAQIGQTFKKADINLTGYYNMYKDFIGEVSAVKAEGKVFWDDGELDPDEYYVNFERRDIIGLELFSRVYPINALRIDFGASVIAKATEEIGLDIRSLDDIAEADLETVSDQLVSEEPINKNETDIIQLSKFSGYGAVNYKFKDHFNVGISTNFGSEKELPADYLDDVKDDAPANAKTENPGFFAIANFHAGAEFDKFGVNFAVKNFTNNTIYTPNMKTTKEYDSEHQGISLEANVKYNF